jgi:hypothetical protein
MLDALKRIESKQPTKAAPVEKTVPEIPAVMDAIADQADAALTASQSVAIEEFKNALAAPWLVQETVIAPAFEEAAASAAEVLDSRLDRTESMMDLAVSPKTPDVYGEMAQYILSTLPAGKPAALVFTAPDDAERKMDAIFRLAENLADHVDGGTVVLDAESKRLHKVTPQGSSRARGQEYLFKPGGRRFDDLKLRYSLVLIDAPPLTQSSAVEMAAQADGVYLMIRLGDTTPRALGEAVDVLRRTGAKWRGSIVIDDGISAG